MPQIQKLSICILFVLSAAAVSVSAQAGDRWSQLASVRAGTQLIVDHDNGRVVKGKFARVTDNSLVLRVSGSEVDLPRDAVAAVHRSRRSSRLKRGMIGALAGAGAGIGIGVAAVLVGKADPLVPAGTLLIGIPVGAAIGAATASSKKGELLYSR